MIKRIFPLALLSFLVVACNNKAKDSVEKADSANKANQDNALNQNDVVVDEKSSQFLVRAAAISGPMVNASDFSRQNAETQPVKDFASQIHKNHLVVLDSIRSLALSNNIFLPGDSLGIIHFDKALFIKKSGLNNRYLDFIVESLQSAIKLYEEAMLDAKEPEIRSFADKTIPNLRAELESASDLKKTLPSIK